MCIWVIWLLLTARAKNQSFDTHSHVSAEEHAYALVGFTHPLHRRVSVLWRAVIIQEQLVPNRWLAGSRQIHKELSTRRLLVFWKGGSGGGGVREKMRHKVVDELALRGDGVVPCRLYLHINEHFMHSQMFKRIRCR